MNDIDKLKKKAYKDGLCSEYRSMWKNCSSPQQYADMAFGVRGMDFLCDAYVKGWGLSTDFWLTKMSAFINGGYISRQEGYTAKAYISYSGEIKTDTTAIMVIDSDVSVATEPTEISQIFVSGKCRLELKGKGRIVLYCYGKPEDIIITGENSNFRRIKKDKKDDYTDRT